MDDHGTLHTTIEIEDEIWTLDEVKQKMRFSEENTQTPPPEAKPCDPIPYGLCRVQAKDGFLDAHILLVEDFLDTVKTGVIREEPSCQMEGDTAYFFKAEKHIDDEESDDKTAATIVYDNNEGSKEKET